MPALYAVADDDKTTFRRGEGIKQAGMAALYVDGKEEEDSEPSAYWPLLDRHWANDLTPPLTDPYWSDWLHHFYKTPVYRKHWGDLDCGPLLRDWAHGFKEWRGKGLTTRELQQALILTLYRSHQEDIGKTDIKGDTYLLDGIPGDPTSPLGKHVLNAVAREFLDLLVDNRRDTEYRRRHKITLSTRSSSWLTKGSSDSEFKSAEVVFDLCQLLPKGFPWKGQTGRGDPQSSTTLTLRQAQVLYGTTVLDETQQELAKTLGIAQPKVNEHYHTALTKIRNAEIFGKHKEIGEELVLWGSSRIAKRRQTSEVKDEWGEYPRPSSRPLSADPPESLST